MMLALKVHYLAVYLIKSNNLNKQTDEIRVEQEILTLKLTLASKLRSSRY